MEAEDLADRIALIRTRIGEEGPPVRYLRPLNALLVEAGFARHTEPIPDVAALTPTQHAVATALATLPDVGITGYALPNRPWKLARWLNPPPDGVLERTVTVAIDGVDQTMPMWRALRVHSGRGKGPVRTFASLDLTLAERLEAYGDIVLTAYNIPRRGVTWGPLGSMDGNQGPWAARMADILLDRSHGSTPMEMRWAVFLGLVRSKTPIASRWDGLLPASLDALQLTVECAQAIPAPRRTAALVGAVRRLSFGSTIAKTGFALLETYPSAALTQLIIDNADSAASAPRGEKVGKRDLKRRLKEIGTRHPVVARTTERWLKKLPPTPLLTLGAISQPDTADQLTQLERQQLELAGRLWDGQDLSAAERLDPNREEGSFAGFLELRTLLAADGSEAYQALLYAGDSGAVFAAGTLEVVAEVIQVAVESPDAGLKDALRELLGSVQPGVGR